MRGMLLVLIGGLAVCPIVSAEDYCAQLQGAGLEGRLVTVHTGDQSGKGYLEGRLVTARPGILVLELSGSRTFINCDKVTSVVVAGTTGTRAPIPDTIESIWRAFGD